MLNVLLITPPQGVTFVSARADKYISKNNDYIRKHAFIYDCYFYSGDIDLKKNRVHFTSEGEHRQIELEWVLDLDEDVEETALIRVAVAEGVEG